MATEFTELHDSTDLEVCYCQECNNERAWIIEELRKIQLKEEAFKNTGAAQ